MKNRKTSHGLECFIKKDGKYLMLRRGKKKRIMPGVWMAPGGHRESYEGLFECARREILEETGLKIKNLKIKVTGVGFMKDNNEEFCVHFLTADYAGGKLKHEIDNGELAWLLPKRIMELDNLLSELRELLPYVFRKKPEVVSFKATYERGNKMVHFEIEKP
jgi:8-oxo-dGTP diphosphatase